ncbi:MAG: SusE domain-containing protein [Tannerellaceae bacterium]|nr:SusE domain-containing protein [Tannerellaceae bacterium]
MKTIGFNLLVIMALIVASAGCSDDGELKNIHVTTVKKLYEPNDGKLVVLQSSASATLYFEWEHAKAEDSGMVLYEIVFDREGGDFSDPVYRMASDNNGGYNHVTITHKQLNKIAAMMGIESSATGKFIWTIFSSKGVNEVKAEESRTIEVTRLAGFADIPIDLYVTGEGSEGGENLPAAVKMKAIAAGEFEVYTQLSAGKSFYFADAVAGTPRRIYTDGELLKEGGTTTVATTGVYKVELDFNVGSAVYTQVTGLGLFFSPTNEILFNLDYIGYGVWKASDKPLNFHQESWGGDERYKFRMFQVKADEEVEIEWGTLNGTDSRPNSSSPASYYYVKEVPVSQWDNKWKFAGEMDGAIIDVTFYLQADTPYTHEVVKIGNQ